ncbi:MAG: tRNA (adenosine(37)-N6)-threonylcarbamoyltransferase complex transferase subunit TsaD [Candidatus Kapaibacterium sp.]
MKILAIESSCDETSAAVISDSRTLSNIISSQTFHSKFGGVVPELASRAHLQRINQITIEALKAAETTTQEIDAIAVTSEPGLVGSLVVGANFAKGLAIKYGLPIIPVNHIEGHLYSGCLTNPGLKFPFVTLVVSGGHTSLFYVESFSKFSVLGSTIDDAAGEAFDKIAKLVGLKYPGGPLIDKLGRQGNPKRYEFPRSMIRSGNFDFSFSGLKTSVRYFVEREFPSGVPESELPDLCASVQSAIVDVLVKKTIDAAVSRNAENVVIAGGVSANSELRRKMTEACEKRGMGFVAPEMQISMDNAAMIGYIAEKRFAEASAEDFRRLDFAVDPGALRAPRKKKKKRQST